jgi:hypothetical protein
MQPNRGAQFFQLGTNRNHGRNHRELEAKLTSSACYLSRTSTFTVLCPEVTPGHVPIDGCLCCVAVTRTLGQTGTSVSFCRRTQATNSLVRWSVRRPELVTSARQASSGPRSQAEVSERLQRYRRRRERAGGSTATMVCRGEWTSQILPDRLANQTPESTGRLALLNTPAESVMVPDADR